MDSINTIFQVIEYMNQHINDELSLDDLCIVSGYTKSHLSYMFKFYIGETPSKYFYKQKLKEFGLSLYETRGLLSKLIIDKTLQRYFIKRINSYTNKY